MCMRVVRSDFVTDHMAAVGRGGGGFRRPGGDITGWKKTSTALQDGRSGWQKDSSQTVSCAVPSTNTPHRLDTHRFYSLSPKTSEQRKEACWQRVLLMKAARTASAAGLHIINTFDLIWKRLICGFNWFFQMWHVTLRQSDPVRPSVWGISYLSCCLIVLLSDVVHQPPWQIPNIGIKSNIFWQ